MKHISKNKKLGLALGALGAGFSSGFFGAGGGAVAVLILIKACGLKRKEAHAAAIGITLPAAAAGAAIYALEGAVDWRTLAWAAPGLICGSVMGAGLTGKIDENLLRRIFGILMIGAGAFMML